MAGTLAIGITGGIGCGKSEVGRILIQHDVPVLDSDDVARAQLRPGEPVFEQVVKRFGSDLLGPDGQVDRRALAQRVFANSADREALNAMMHPPILERIKDWLRVMRSGRRGVAVIVPLLYEVNMTDMWNAVICVAADEAVAVERLKKRGWSETEIRDRMASQMPLEEKMKKTKHIIHNNGSLDALELETMTVWNNLMKKE